MKTCQDTTLDIERAKFERLSFKDRWALRAHVKICPSCREYFKDSKVIHRILTKKFEHKSEYSFSIEEKEKLKNDLKNS